MYQVNWHRSYNFRLEIEKPVADILDDVVIWGRGEMTDLLEPQATPDSSTALDIIDSVAPEGWRSKMGMVAAQLLAGTKWGAEYYARVREVKDHADAKSRINAVVAEAVGQQAITDPQFMERAKARLLGDIYQKQENLEAVIASATLLLEDQSPPKAASDEQPEQPPFEPDWAAAFNREAELATSDELRGRLAKVLAGELIQPGTFPRSTVRMIAELDRRTLENFENILPYRFADVIYVPQDWKEGDRIGPLLEAEAAGFLVFSAQPLQRTVQVQENGKGFLFGKKYALMFEGPPETKVLFSIVRLTRDGQAIANLLDRLHEEAILVRAAENTDKSSFSAVFLLKLQTVDGEDGFYLHRQLWPEPVPIEIGADPFEPPRITPGT